MSVSREKIDAVVAAVLAGKKVPIDLDALQGHLENLEQEDGVEWNTGSTPDYVYSDSPIPDWYDYSIDLLDDYLSEERYDELKAGAEPTAKEIEKWREAYIEQFFEDPEWDGGYLVRTIRDSKGREIAALLLTSGGGWDYGESIDGLFRTADDAYVAMNANEHVVLEPF